MSKHTKGPWLRRGSINEIIEIIGPHGTNAHICEVTGSFVSKEESNANANLIIASVDLLTSCKSFFAAKTEKEKHHAMVAMEEAIEKAERNA